MAQTSIQHLMVPMPAQPHVISRHRGEPGTREVNGGADQPAARHRQVIGAPASRPRDRWRGPDAPADTDQPCLPPECWYG